MMRAQFLYAGYFLAPLFLSVGSSRGIAEEAGARSVPSEIPPSWSVAEIAKATPPYGTDDPVYILAWKITEDERRRREESCLVMKVLVEDDDYGRWSLAHLLRDPSDEKPAWRLGMLIHVGGHFDGNHYHPGMWIHQNRRFKDKPGNKQIYAALPTNEVRWSFELRKGCSFVSCGVCEQRWNDVIGEKPTRFFRKQSKDESDLVDLFDNPKPDRVGPDSKSKSNQSQ